jgi:uncharacterized protein with FMN-binding domain
MSELMRRAAPGLALAGIALSTVWLFDPALHPQPAPGAAAAATGDSSDPGTSGDGGTSPDAGTSSDPGTSSDAGSTDPGSADTGTDASGCSAADTVTGDAVMTRWGPVQVAMSFAADGSVCDVHAVAYPANDPHSANLNAMAVPYLDRSALQVGVDFDAVSGATYTSEAYRQSMQSILDQR